KHKTKAPTKLSDFEKLIHEWGIPVNELSTVRSGIEGAIDFYHELEKKRHELPYDIDGTVVKIDDLNLQRDLGFIARSPRWATAAKYKPEQGQTVVERIEVQVGRTGALTPVAIMNPVKVG